MQLPHSSIEEVASISVSLVPTKLRTVFLEQRRNARSSRQQPSTSMENKSNGPAISGTQGEVDIGVQSWLCFQGKHCLLFKFQCSPPLFQSHKVILPSLPLPHHQSQHTKLSASTFKFYDLEIVHREMDENYHNSSTTDQNYSSCSVPCLEVLQCFLQIWKNNLCYYATGSGG